MIKFQLANAWFDEINDHKHDTYLNGLLSTKLLAQAANKINTFMFTKTRRLLFFLSMVLEVTVQKNSKESLPKCKLKK